MGSSSSRGDSAYHAVPGSDSSSVANRFSHGHDDTCEENDLPSVIQFSCAVYYCEESEKQMTFEIVRLGEHVGEASCEWYTEDSSAKAGVKYVKSGGYLTFTTGETTKMLTVTLLDDDSWDATLEFGIVVHNVSGAQLGKYLNRCRVKIIDDDVFPTNVYEDKLRNHREADIPGAALMLQYFRMNLRNSVVRRDSIKQVVIDQCHGLYFVLVLYLQMYLVDVVLAPSDLTMRDDGRLLKQIINSSGRLLSDAWMPVHSLLVPGHRRATAIVIAGIWVVPFGLLHLIDLCKCYFCIPGAARKTLQGNLLRRFLHYREDIHSKRIGSSDITMAIVRDVVEVVDSGYMKILEVLRILGKITFATIFIVAENKIALIPLVAYPIVLGCFLCCRERKTLLMNDLKAIRQDQVVQTVSDCIRNYRVIADFALRPFIVDTYEKQIDTFHEQESAACATITNNSYMAPWLTTLSIGLYIIVGASMVESLGGDLSLGTFLATIHVFKDIGSEMQEIYGECLEIQRSFVPLRKICHFMNLETDLPHHLRVNRMRRKHGEEVRNLLRQAAGREHQNFIVDQVGIEIKDLSFAYSAHAPRIMSCINLSFRQGQLYSFVGPPHEGKGTLLKLLGQVLLPHEGGGYIFVPPHLRVLHVSSEGTILPGTLLQNISLNQALERVGGMERIYKLCKRIGFSPHLLQHLSDSPPAENVSHAPHHCAEEPEDIPWPARLSDTDHSRLTLARVFAMNPECVIFHKPAGTFNQVEGKHIIKCIRNFVDERGLELPIKARQFRRPRTVFFTSSSVTGVEEADRVYRVCVEGIWPIDRNNVDERLLQ